MEVADSSASASVRGLDSRPPDVERKQMRVKRRTLQALLEQVQTSLEILKNADLETRDEDGVKEGEGEGDRKESASQGTPLEVVDESETDELCDLLKSRVESPNFLEKFGSIHLSVSHNFSEETSWDMITTKDLWEDKQMDGESESNGDGYILVSQEDIVDSIACFMAAYLLSLKETKDLNPNQLQEALCKTFSVKKKKGKLRKAWDGSKVVYNVASWGATAIGIYQNPALLRAASAAFWTSCRVISKLL